MKKLLLILLLAPVLVFSQQRPLYMRAYDTVHVGPFSGTQGAPSGNTELRIYNSTRGITGFLKNIGGGRTQFAAISQADIAGLQARLDSISGKVPQSRTLSINGEVYDLSANRSWTIATGVPTSRTITIDGVTFDLSANRSWTTSGGSGDSRVIVRTTLDSLRNLTVDKHNTYRYVGMNGVMWDFWVDTTDATTADDGIYTLVTTAGKRLKRETLYINPFDFGLRAGAADNSAAINAMWQWIEDHPAKRYVVWFPSGDYNVEASTELPHRINSLGESVRVKILGNGTRLKTTTDGVTIFRRMPATQTEATDQLISNWIGHIEGFIFEGDGGTGQKGIDIGATYSWQILENNFSSLDTALMVRFGLQPTINGNRFTLNKTDNIHLTYGQIWGGGVSTSATNSASINDTRVFGANGARTHVYALAANAPRIVNFISEGFKPQYNFWLDGDASTVVTQAHIEDVHLEANGGVYANNTVFRLRAGGVWTIKNIYPQFPDTLFNTTGSAGSSKIIFEGLTYMGALPAGVAFNANGASTLGYHLIFRVIHVGATTFLNKIKNPASWVGGVRPIEVFVEAQGESGSGSWEIIAGGAINLKPGWGEATNSPINTYGHILFPTDAQWDIGGLYGFYNTRPRNLLVGQNIYLSNAGRFYFGDALTTPDVGFSRSGAGQLSIINNNFSDWRDLKLRNTINTGTISAIALTRDATTTDSATVINPSNGLLTQRKINFPAPTTDASLLTSGILPDARLGDNVAMRNEVNNFTQDGAITKAGDAFWSVESTAGDATVGIYSATQNLELIARDSALIAYGGNTSIALTTEGIESYHRWRIKYDNGTYTQMLPSSDGKLVVTQTGTAPEWYFDTDVYINGEFRLPGGSTGQVPIQDASGKLVMGNVTIPPFADGTYDHINASGSGTSLQLNSAAIDYILNYFETNNSLLMSMFPDTEFDPPVDAITNGEMNPPTSNAVYDYLASFSGITAGDKGDITVTLGPENWSIDNAAITPAKLSSSDFGDFAVAAGVATIDNAAITPAKLSSSDFGDFTVAAGVATIESGAITVSELGGLGTGVGTWLGTPTSANLRAALSDEVGTGAAYFVGGALGTPASANLSNATDLPIGGITGFGSGVATWLATPSSANLAAAVTGETGTGNLVFSASPTFTGTVGAADITASGNGLFSTLRTNTSSTLSSGSVEMLTIGGTVNHSGTSQSTAMFISPFYQSPSPNGDFLIAAGNRTAAYPSGTHTNLFVVDNTGYTWNNQGYGSSTKSSDLSSSAGVIKLFNRLLANRGMSRQVGTDNMSTYFFQPFMGTNRIGFSSANFGTATLSNLGAGSNTAEGTASSLTMGSTQAGESNSTYTFKPRVRVTSASAAANQPAGYRSIGHVAVFGNNTGEGGFFAVFQGGTAQFQTGSKGFMGFSASGDIPNTATISTMDNMIGIAYDNQTTWRIVSNDASDPGTEHADLGANFPTNVDDDGIITFAIYAPSNQNTTAYWYVKRVTNAGVIYENAGTMSSDLPQVETPLYWHSWLNTGTATANVIWDFMSVYVEAEN
jgi:hypothetical protein